MSKRECRWGFLSTAGIARKNWKAVRLAGNARLAAVASRSQPKAQAFIDECQAEVPFPQPAVACGAYQELIDRDDIDAVYIPLPTGIRKEWVIAAAEAGKHVLVEKPVANNVADAQEMIDACARSGVQFMDGVMFDHSKRLARVCDAIKDGTTIGQLQRIYAQFSFCGDGDFQKSNIRTDSVLEPHGCLGDLGWYCIRFTLWAAGLRVPTKISARTISAIKGGDSDGEVPGEFSAEMQFADGFSASFFCSFLTSNSQVAVVSGQQGVITLDDFVLPFYDAEAAWHEHQHVLEIDNCRWNFQRRSSRQAIAEYAGGEPNSQEVNMVRRMSEIAISGKLDPLYPELTTKTQAILDACRRSDVADGAWISL
ncbi:Gfo/Idh/MocA family protein [Planctomycetes bacterium K23_9]|uniref:Glucose--fructose oxidoreductase n=1 Tax=Stieleria marina TaxID=1930275 RepID=A0A517NY07_9BACT|nr:Glucose--fructose oxidoreductase precursor [Planctomycetes bacterium K23_9]